MGEGRFPITNWACLQNNEHTTLTYNLHNKTNN